MPYAIHQLTAGFTGHDAISNEARTMRDLFRRRGHPSEIFSESAHVPPELEDQATDVGRCHAQLNSDDVVLLHLSMGSLVNQVFAELPCRKVILYHNITPGHFFAGLNPAVSEDLERGRAQAKALHRAADLVLADSGFNAQELQAMGYAQVRVFPLMLDLDKLVDPLDAGKLAAYGDRRTNVICVGRGAPNKAIEQVLEAFHWFQSQHVSSSRFLHVGSFAGTRLYQALCRARARELGVEDAHFLGTLSQAELNAVYHGADLFLCLSNHEGFCIPLLEAMRHDVPVLAYDAGAVAETLDGAGVLVRDKDPALLASLMARIVQDAPLRDRIVAQQRRRIERYRNRDLEGELYTLIRERFG